MDHFLPMVGAGTSAIKIYKVMLNLSKHAPGRLNTTLPSIR